MSIENILKHSNVGTKIYVDNASQPYIIVAKNDLFIIAIKRNFITKHIAFDIDKNKCGYFIGFDATVNFDDEIEVNQLLQDLSKEKIKMYTNRIKNTEDVVRKIKVGTEIIYG